MTLVKFCIRIISATIIIVGVPAILGLFFLDYSFLLFIGEVLIFFFDILTWIINNFTIYENINSLLKILVLFLTFWIAVLTVALICIGIFRLLSTLAKYIFKNARETTYKNILKPFFVYFAVNIFFGLLTFVGYLPDAEGPIKFISLFMIMLYDEVFSIPFNGDLFLQANLLIVFFLRIGISRGGEVCPYCNRFFTTEYLGTEDISNEEKDITKKESVRVGTKYITTTVTNGWDKRTYTNEQGIYESQDVTRRYNIYTYISTFFCKYCGETFTKEGTLNKEAGSPEQYALIEGKGAFSHIISTKKK